MVVFSSSKVTINRSCALLVCFFTPLIFFRIELIRALEFQDAQPGIVNWIVLSAAKAAAVKVKKNRKQTNITATFFIFNLDRRVGI